MERGTENTEERDTEIELLAYSTMYKYIHRSRGMCLCSPNWSVAL